MDTFIDIVNAIVDAGITTPEIPQLVIGDIYKCGKEFLRMIVDINEDNILYKRIGGKDNGQLFYSTPQSMAGWKNVKGD